MPLSPIESRSGPKTSSVTSVESTVCFRNNPRMPSDARFSTGRKTTVFNVLNVFKGPYLGHRPPPPRPPTPLSPPSLAPPSNVIKMNEPF